MAGDPQAGSLCSDERPRARGPGVCARPRAGSRRSPASQPHGAFQSRLLCASHTSETLLLVRWHPSSVGHTSPDPQWVPGTVHILCFFFPYDKVEFIT